MPEESTSTLTGSPARKKILAGVNRVYDPVKLTLGPAGRNALLPRTWNRGPRITNDGYTVIELARLVKDPHERLAAEAFAEASQKTNQLAGDGTTGTSVFAGSLFNENAEKIGDDTPVIEVNGNSKVNVRALRKEMKEAKDLVLEEIKKKSKPVKTIADLEKIARISIGVEDEEISKTVAQMVWKLGRDSAGNFVDNYIDTTEGYKGEIETETIEGMRFPAKVADKAFITNPERFEMVAKDTKILLTNYTLDNPVQVAQMLGKLQQPKIAIFAPEFSSQVLQMLLKNSEKGLLFYPVKCPALRTEQLEDLAAYTNAVIIDKTKGHSLDTAQPANLGFAAKIVVKDVENREDAILIGGQGQGSKEVKDRQEILKGQMKEARNDMTKGQLERRIANLSAAVGVIRVGSSTSGEGLYLKLKIEDGVFACKAALQEGYVKGGGLCLKEIAEKLPKNILTESLKAPYEQIQKNSGGIEVGAEVIDPTKVVRLIVEHGVAIVSTLITAEISIANTREKSPGEGYEDIAKSILAFTRLYGKHHSLLKDNEDYEEQMRNKAFEEAMLKDKD